MVCRDLRHTKLRFHIYSRENGFRKLPLKFDGNPTVGSKVMAFSNRYYGLERKDLDLTE
jgi:hypothetical protein